jgi:predicted RNA binding protein YcfA (HicA-like mRNA interferase family)
MPITPKEMIKLLEMSGFQEERQNGSHKFFRNPKTNKCTTVPYHSKTLKKGLEHAILKQAGLS